MAIEVVVEEIEMEMEMWVRPGLDSSELLRVGTFTVSGKQTGEDLVSVLTKIVSELGKRLDEEG